MEKRIAWLDQVSALLDTRFRIPFTNIRFGWDFVLGLLPGVGDALSFAISGALVLGMARHGVGGKVLLMMLGNILLDLLTGSVPVLGDIFDLAYKANRRNFRLFQKYHNEDKHKGSGCGILLILLALFALAIWAIISVSTWFFGLVF